MKGYIDLHTHTTYSDGTSTPEQLLAMVRQSNLAAFAVTDHDTLDGYRVVRDLLTDDDPELVPGVELSVTVENGDMHILAYLIETEDKQMCETLKDFQRRRSERGRTMVDRLNSLGFDITYSDVEKQAGNGVVGRPHVARAMYEKNCTGYYEEAFERYIGYDGPAYVPKANFTPGEAIDLIHNAGGLAVLAHPAIDDKERYLPMLVDLGLDGLEIYHPYHAQSHIDRYKHLAKKYRLLVTGGSDFHGANGRYALVGTQKVPFEYLEQLKATQEVRRS